MRRTAAADRESTATAAKPPSNENGRARSTVLSDQELKRRALKRLQRLASSGLSFEPFARTTFDIVSDAIPQAEHKTLSLSDRFEKTLLVGYPSGDWHENFLHLLRCREELSGFRFFPIIFGSPKTVIWHEQFQLSNYRKAQMWNEVFRPLGVEHSLFTVLKELGEIVGNYPIDRPASMKPFTRDDELFMAAAAPHIAHGIRTAQLSSVNPAEQGGFVRNADSSEGIVLLGTDGCVLGLDGNARSIFRQIGVLDNLPVDPFAATNAKSALEYIARVLHSVFLEKGESSFDLAAPVTRVYSHHSGITLNLRGFLVDGDPGTKYFTVIVEQGETADQWRKQLMFRHGLSPREVELLGLLARRLPSHEIAGTMRITRETLKTYWRRIIDKLELDNQLGLIRFAEQLALRPC